MRRVAQALISPVLWMAIWRATVAVSLASLAWDVHDLAYAFPEMSGVEAELHRIADWLEAIQKILVYR
jgi:hypothetical protein